MILHESKAFFQTKYFIFYKFYHHIRCAVMWKYQCVHHRWSLCVHCRDELCCLPNRVELHCVHRKDERCCAVFATDLNCAVFAVELNCALFAVEMNCAVVIWIVPSWNHTSLCYLSKNCKHLKKPVQSNIWRPLLHIPYFLWYF